MPSLCSRRSPRCSPRRATGLNVSRHSGHALLSLTAGLNVGALSGRSSAGSLVWPILPGVRRSAGHGVLYGDRRGPWLRWSVSRRVEVSTRKLTEGGFRGPSRRDRSASEHYRRFTDGLPTGTPMSYQSVTIIGHGPTVCLMRSGTTDDATDGATDRWSARLDGRRCRDRDLPIGSGRDERDGSTC